MDRSLVLVCLCVCLTHLELTHAYYVRYLNVTANSLLDNRRLLHRYVSCFANDGPCPPQARDIKKLLPELMRSSCAKCDVKLRQVFERCKQLLQYKYPDKWSNMYLTKPTQNSL